MTLIGTRDRISSHRSSISSNAMKALAMFGLACRTGKLRHLLCPVRENRDSSQESPSHDGLPSRLLAFFLMIPVSLGSGGCALRMGPKMVPHDRFDYSSVIERSWKEQMLLNMVRLRYLDPPFFLDVQQVIAQYTLEGSGTVGGTGLGGGPSASARGQRTVGGESYHHFQPHER